MGKTFCSFCLQNLTKSYHLSFPTSALIIFLKTQTSTPKRIFFFIPHYLPKAFSLTKRCMLALCSSSQNMKREFHIVFKLYKMNFCVISATKWQLKNGVVCKWMIETCSKKRELLIKSLTFSQFPSLRLCAISQKKKKGQKHILNSQNASTVNF